MVITQSHMNKLLTYIKTEPSQLKTLQHAKEQKNSFYSTIDTIHSSSP